MKRNVFIGSTLLALLIGLGAAQTLLQRTAAAQAQGAVQAPRFEVDPIWPKPLPNGWYLGQVIGVSVDANDHVWIIHRSAALDAVEAAADEGTGPVARRRRRFSSSINRGICSATGAARMARAISGPSPTTGSRSITRATSGLAATATATTGTS